NFDPEQAQRFQQMRESMNELTQTGEASLAKILEKGQFARVKQIQFQLQYPDVVLRDDMVEKLNINEEQLEQLQELRNERREAQREIRKSQGAFMKNAFQAVNPAGGNDGGGGGNGNGGNQGGNGRNNRPRFDPEVMKKVMDSPEVKAQMEQVRG